MKLNSLGFQKLMELRGGFEAQANAGYRVDTSSIGSIKPAGPHFMSTNFRAGRSLL